MPDITTPLHAVGCRKIRLGLEDLILTSTDMLVMILSNFIDPDGLLSFRENLARRRGINRGLRRTAAKSALVGAAFFVGFGSDQFNACRQDVFNFGDAVDEFR